MVRTAFIIVVVLSAGCSTARLVPPPPLNIPNSGSQRVVVVEPFFENSQWKLSTRADRATVYDPGYGPGYGPEYGPGLGPGTGTTFGPGYGPNYGPGYSGPRDITVYRDVAEKPIYARVPTLIQEQRAVIAAVQRLRPHWRVASTSDVLAVNGPVTLIRVIIGEPEIIESNRAFKTLACAFGVLIWPLLLFQLSPVDETQRVHGALVRFDADAADLRPRLMRYQTQPDFAVDTRGLNAQQQPFGLDLEYKEGVLASESSREPVLVSGFVQRLSIAVVAMVEGVK